MVLAQAEFAFNNMKNRTTGKCLSEIVYTKALRLTFDLTSLPKEVEIQEEAERLQKLHTGVINLITKTTESYKEEKNETRKEVHFQVEDFVMAHLKKNRFLIGTYGKLKDKQIGPCRILAKYEPNADKIKLPEGFNISPIFNVTDLRSYNASDGFQLS
ncbi:DNA/RNA polymerases superfamily protein [Cucumis melo var. makuwa]|uniref:DNA/RNA polymerases superfamily protein n=1 Tax=Cucumis melo var. makuwa TaxID=1194695 RepID=A0A5D3CDD0_CUCMM|nr:DNA/RNA polymerases superfamily protein [Cucumis melo var. makuwa]TYK08349.1 DNA/RNA polymerases superfamily protein [Cucumis melo var. makuwa]